MKSNMFFVFHFFRNKGEYLKQISEGGFSWKMIIHSVSLVLLLLFVYGLIIGSYHSLYQAIAAGLKLPVLFMLSILICLPTFHVIQIILGSRITLKNLVSVIISGAVLSSWILVAFIPIVVFFMLTGDNYYFLVLLHIAIMGFSSFFGVRLIVEALKYSCETENIYPKAGIVVFRIWMLIFLFVSIQLGWNLRPFLGDRNEKFKVFREYEGNFYTAIIYTFDKLTNPQKPERKKEDE